MHLPAGSAYYAGKTLFLTGGTGLVGQATIETILRALPQVRRLYVLIRPRRDAAGTPVPVERTLHEELLANGAFDALRSEHGDRFGAWVAERVVPVAGDLSRDRLGLSNDDWNRIRAEVDVVIHSGAMAVFDAPLDLAVRTNARAPLQVLELARGAPKRPLVAHLSTCYVQAGPGPAFESPLDPTWTPNGNGAHDPYDVDDELARIDRALARRPDSRSGPEAHDAQVAEGLRWSRQRGFQDTYAFTKAMGEQSVARHRGDVPTLIVRPAVIESALRTPAPGWIDGYRMLEPLVVGYARRRFADFPGHPEAVLDVVPVDTVVHALLMAIPWAARQEGLPVVQIASGTENPLRLSEFRAHVREHYERNPLGNHRSAARPPLPDLTFPPVRRYLRELDLAHLAPVRFLQAAYRPLRGTRWGRKRYDRLSVGRERLERLRRTAVIYGPYGECRARFGTHVLRRVHLATPEEDRAAFPFDLRGLDWKRYLQDVHLAGVERYLLGRRDRVVAALPLPNGAADRDPPTGTERWRSAERVLARTREVPANEARRWTGGAVRGAVRRASVATLQAVCALRLELRTSGLERLPERGPAIVVANHASHADTGVLLAALGRRLGDVHATAAQDYWFRNPWVGRAMHLTLGGIPFDRHRPNVPRALSLPAEVLRGGRSLIFYPEGTRSPDGEVHPFRSTVGLLALATATEIVPAYLSGTAEALPKGSAWVRHHPVRVRFGAPVRIEPYLARLDHDRVAEVARRIAADAHARVLALRDELETAPAGAAPRGREEAR